MKEKYKKVICIRDNIKDYKFTIYIIDSSYGDSFVLDNDYYRYYDTFKYYKFSDIFKYQNIEVRKLIIY